MKVKKPPLALGEPTDVHYAAYLDAHAQQRRTMRQRRDNQCSVVLEADEPTIEQLIDARREQEPVLAVERSLVFSRGRAYTRRASSRWALYLSRNNGRPLDP